MYIMVRIPHNPIEPKSIIWNKKYFLGRGNKILSSSYFFNGDILFQNTCQKWHVATSTIIVVLFTKSMPSPPPTPMRSMSHCLEEEENKKIISWYSFRFEQTSSKITSSFPVKRSSIKHYKFHKQERNECEISCNFHTFFIKWYVDLIYLTDLTWLICDLHFN